MIWNSATFSNKISTKVNLDRSTQALSVWIPNSKFSLSYSYYSFTFSVFLWESSATVLQKKNWLQANLLISINLRIPIQWANLISNSHRFIYQFCDLNRFICFPQLIFLSAGDLEVKLVCLLFNRLKLELLETSRLADFSFCIELFPRATSLLGGERRGGRAKVEKKKTSLSSFFPFARPHPC